MNGDILILFIIEMFNKQRINLHRMNMTCCLTEPINKGTIPGANFQYSIIFVGL